MVDVEQAAGPDVKVERPECDRSGIRIMQRHDPGRARWGDAFDNAFTRLDRDAFETIGQHCEILDDRSLPARGPCTERAELVKADPVRDQR
jgi:hypothetical protein